jgi:hypothetical protein
MRARVRGLRLLDTAGVLVVRSPLPPLLSSLLDAADAPVRKTPSMVTVP